MIECAGHRIDLGTASIPSKILTDSATVPGFLQKYQCVLILWLLILQGGPRGRVGKVAEFQRS